MASARQIKAGEAWWEMALRDKLTPALKRVQGKMTAFGTTLKAMGASLAVVGGGIVAAMAKSVSTFMEVSRHAKNIGAAIAGIDASKADKLIAAWNTLKATFGAIQFLVGSAIAEPLTQLLHIAINLGVKFAKFVKENQGLVVAIAAVGAAALVVGTALAGLGVAITFAWSAVTGIIAAFTALATPVGVIVAIVVGGVAAWFAFSKAGQDAASGIASAIATNDIPGAMSMVVQSLATMWAQWSDFVVQNIAKAAKTAINIWQSAVKSIAKFLTDAGVTSIHTEEEKAKKLREAQIISNLRNMETLAGQADAARAKGGSIQVGSQMQTAEQIDAAWEALSKQTELLIAQRAAGAPAGAISGAHEAIDQQVNEIGSSLKEFVEAMKAASADARTAAESDLHSEAERHRENLRVRLKGIEGFAAAVGSPIGSGSSAGAFGGTAGALLGVGAGGGLKVTDEKGNALLERIIKALSGLEVEAEFK